MQRDSLLRQSQGQPKLEEDSEVDEEIPHKRRHPALNKTSIVS